MVVMLDVKDIVRDITGTILGLHNCKSYKILLYTDTHIHVIDQTLIRDVMLKLKQHPMKIATIHGY